MNDRTPRYSNESSTYSRSSTELTDMFSISRLPSNNYCPPTISDIKLVQVQLIFRHGARMPLMAPELGLPPQKFTRSMTKSLKVIKFPYQLVNFHSGKKMDPPVDTVMHGKKYGSITTIGQVQMVQLGRHFREVYGEQFGLTSFSQDVSIRSSNIKRTVISLCCVLAGMFGTDNLKEVGPIIIPVKLQIVEDIFPNHYVCPHVMETFRHLHQELEHLPEYKYDLLAMKSKVNLTSGANYVSLHDYIKTSEAHDLDIPSDLKPFREIIFQNAAKIMFSLTTCMENKYSTDMTSLTIGTFIHTLLAEMEAYAAGKPCPKLYLYSGHDTTVAILLHAMGAWRDVWPDFASHIALELYEDSNKDLFVRPMFNGETMQPFKEKGGLVSLSEFKSLLSPFILSPTEHHTRCNLHSHHRDEFSESWLKKKCFRFGCCCTRKNDDSEPASLS